jgi:ABC-type nitrate/sulfonate/bicarbonate transport system permease component
VTVVRLLLRTRLSGVLLISAILALWEILTATKTLDYVSFPRFSDVVLTGATFVADGQVLTVLAPSLRRLAIGYGIATALGVTLGMLMGTFFPVFNLLEPITEVLRPMPSAAMIPILILFLGLGDETKVAIIVFASTFPILVNTYSGVRAIDPVQINTARTLGLNTPAILWEVVLPAASPYIFTGMRISLGVAFVLVIVSEMLTGGGGLGYFILDTQRTYRVKETYVGIVIVGALGYLLNMLFLMVQRKVIGWHAESARSEPL